MTENALGRIAKDSVLTEKGRKDGDTEMYDLEKVIQALEICSGQEPGKYTCYKCPYEIRVDGDGCDVNLMLDAIGLIKEQEEEIKKIREIIEECHKIADEILVKRS